MSLESATYVNQLVVSNPDGADPKGQGDDHLRLIKNTLKNTFPLLDAPVTVSSAELNNVAGGLRLTFQGMIVLWWGVVGTIPAGWLLCNGANFTPDLRDRFVVGAGGSYAPGSGGGSVTHTHGISVGGTALSVAQLPPHSHNTGTLGDNINFTPGRAAAGGPANFAGVETTQTGSGAAHDHPASASTVDHRPPYYALCYIMKT